MSDPTPHRTPFAERGKPWYDPQGRKRCGAKASHGGPCLAMPVRGKNRCKNHGGLSPSGPEHPSFKDGRYSTALPTNLLAAYQEAVTDPELLELRSDAALLHTFLIEALGRMDGSANRGLWKAARGAFRDFQDGLRQQDQGAMRDALDRLEEIIDAGLSAAAGREEVRTLVQERRRVVESERKRLVEMQQTITAERAATLFGALLSIAGRYVTDADQREAMKREALGLFALPGGEAAA